MMGGGFGEYGLLATTCFILRLHLYDGEEDSVGMGCCASVDYVGGFHCEYIYIGFYGILICGIGFRRLRLVLFWDFICIMGRKIQ